MGVQGGRRGRKRKRGRENREGREEVDLEKEWRVGRGAWVVRAWHGIARAWNRESDFLLVCWLGFMQGSLVCV